MGAAIECFPGAEAILIPRTRFAPVKTTSDMLALMSDAYTITPDFRMELAPERNGVPPDVKLDGGCANHDHAHFNMICSSRTRSLARPRG